MADLVPLIKLLFFDNYQYKEIIGKLSVIGHNLTIDQLRYILRKEGLFRRRGCRTELLRSIDLVAAQEAIIRRLNGDGQHKGIRWHLRMLQHEDGLCVTRGDVTRILRELDPDGPAMRLRNRLRRRTYRTLGPNHLWHMDGMDKLNQFGFFIHGCIDGFSRKLIWLRVARTNKNPKVVAFYYIHALKQGHQAPKLLRADCGTENVAVADCRISIHGENSFIYGRSVHNQRIEAMWSQLAPQTRFYIEYFSALLGYVGGGTSNSYNPVLIELLQFCFNPVVQDWLDRFVEFWNGHKIRVSPAHRAAGAVGGRPNDLYSDYQSIGIDTSTLDFAELETRYVELPKPCPDESMDAFCNLCTQYGLAMSNDLTEATILFRQLCAILGI